MGARKIRIIVLGLLAVAANAATAQELSRTETDSLRLLYFDPTETYLVPRVIQTYHDSLERQKSILGWEPREKTTVLLTDFADYGNAGASANPRNSVIIDVAPIPFTFETTQPAERMYTFMNHEMVHVATMDQPAAADLSARGFFRGKVLATAEHPETILYQYLTSPRKSTPRWYLEGIAVFIETWMAGGLGRAQGGYDEMMFRAKVRDGAHFYDPLGLVAEGTQVDFQVGANAYLYGGRFMAYLAYQYSPEMLIEWIKRTDDSHRWYEKDFERVFGLSLNDAWDDWIEFEKAFQTTNLEQIREYPVTPYEDLTESALGSVSRAYYDPGRNSLIAGFRYPGVLAHIGELSLDTGKVDRLKDIKIPMIYRVSSVAYDPSSKTIFYTADNYAYRDLMAIDLATGKQRVLMKDARIGELVYNQSDGSIWGIRHLHGYASIVRISYPYSNWQLIETLPYGEVAYDLDISPDGTLLSGSFGDVEGNQRLKVFRIEDLLAKKFEPVHTFDFNRAVPEGFVFSPDGKYLFGSSYFTGVSNIFRYELETGELEAVSNTDTGFFRPIPLDNENLIVFQYTGDGFKPARIKAEPLEDVNAVRLFGTEIIRKYPRLIEWRAGSPDSPPAESRIVETGVYDPTGSMGLESMYPVVLGYKDSTSLGLRFNFTDPIRFRMLNVTAGYNVDGDVPSDERPNFALEYQHTVISSSPFAGTWRFGARHNYADFYDLFGPTKKSRKGNRFYVGYEKTLLFDDPRRLALTAEVNHYNDLDALPRFQNVVATIDELSSIELGIDYENVRKSLGAVDDEKGFLFHFGVRGDYVDSEMIPKVQAGFDFGVPLPWKHSSIWFRNDAGFAIGSPNDEFAQFYFGGFGNNDVDRGSIKRYRDYYALPGAELNAVAGRDYHRAMLEWNLPPLRFQRFGNADAFLSWARPALFASWLTTNHDRTVPQQNYRDIGIQIDFRFTIMARMEMTLSLGYAKAYGNNDFEDDEFMASLKIM